MKTLILLLSLVTFPVLLNRNNDEHTLIIGQWNLCSTISYNLDADHKSKKVITSYYVCPVITFAKDSTGFAGVDSSEKRYFHWSVKDGKIQIQNKSEESIIADGSYIIKYKKGVLELIDSISSIKTFKYILGGGHSE